MEDLREKLSAAERSIHTLNSEIDEENDTIDGLQEEIDKLVAQLEDTHSHDEEEMETMRRQLETKTAKFESLQAKDLELAEQERREAEEILQLKRVIEEMSVEMESVKRDWGTPGLCCLRQRKQWAVKTRTRSGKWRI